MAKKRATLCLKERKEKQTEKLVKGVAFLGYVFPDHVLIFSL